MVNPVNLFPDSAPNSDAAAEEAAQILLYAQTMPRKKAQIVVAANEEFLKRGFVAASMDSIAARAGVSKATVYAHFGSKTELFSTMIRALSAVRLSPLFDDGPPPADMVTALTRLANAIAQYMYTPRALGLYRVVIGEAPRFPELAHAFYDAGPGANVNRLSRWMAVWGEQGLLAIEDPIVTAQDFYNLIRGDHHTRMLLGLCPAESPPDTEALAKRVVMQFIKLYGTAA